MQYEFSSTDKARFSLHDCLATSAELKENRLIFKLPDGFYCEDYSNDWPNRCDLQMGSGGEYMLRLIRPNREHEAQALDFKQEFFDNGEKVINGSELLDQMDCYEEWLVSVTNNVSEETVNPAWVVTDTFFAVDESGRIVGIIDLRHTLNDFLKDFGNCGYSVRPSERRKGYATEMLRQLLEVAKKSGMDELHLSVERDNEPSIKTIVSNGGIYERSFEFENEMADIYRIAL